MDRKHRRTGQSESTAHADGLAWSVECRLTHVELRLFWLGAINRTDLIRRFGVSMSQASADINRYLALNPTGVAYDKSAKCYVADDRFRPVLGADDATRLLGEMRLVDAGLLTAPETRLGVLPPFAATPMPERPVGAAVLRTVWRSIDQARGLEILYQSMSRPEPARRVIEPHALAHDGFRWHARAFDGESGTFRDFVLGRIAEAATAGPRRSSPDADAEWNSHVELRIAPHPGLNRAQAKAIRLDYGITGRSAVLRVRRALLFYALKRLGLDTLPDARSPQEQHIILINREDVTRELGRPEDV